MRSARVRGASQAKRCQLTTGRLKGAEDEDGRRLRTTCGSPWDDLTPRKSAARREVDDSHAVGSRSERGSRGARCGANENGSRADKLARASSSIAAPGAPRQRNYVSHATSTQPHVFQAGCLRLHKSTACCETVARPWLRGHQRWPRRGHDLFSPHLSTMTAGPPP